MPFPVISRGGGKKGGEGGLNTCKANLYEKPVMNQGVENAGVAFVKGASERN